MKGNLLQKFQSYKYSDLLPYIDVVAEGSSKYPGMRCSVVHITTPVVDVICPVALFCTISAGCATVEVSPPILQFLTVFTVHSWHDVVCRAVKKERIVIVGLVTSPVAIGHCSWNNPFALPHPATVFPTVAERTLHRVQGFTLVYVAHDIEDLTPVILVCC